MTANQIAYQNLKEEQRKNRVQEAETQRHNQVTEAETGRHNVTTERETMRYNKNKNASDYMKAGADILKSVTGVARLFVGGKGGK